MQKGFTLMESLIVIVIIGILSTIALFNYLVAKERALDKEAISNLKVIQAAERAYYIDMISYYPNAGSETNIVNINQNLKLSLSAAPGPSWNYAVWNNGCAKATRNVTDGRSLYFRITEEGEPNDGSVYTCP